MHAKGIEARGEDGRYVWIVKLRPRIYTSIGGHVWTPQMPRYALLDGSPVLFNENGFVVAANGERLTTLPHSTLPSAQHPWVV